MGQRDGRRVRSLDPVAQLVPHLFERRTDAQVLARQFVLVGETDRW